MKNVSIKYDMWETVKQISHGRLSLRQLSLMVSAFMLACFVTIGPLTNVAFAEDAVRKSNDTINFQGKEYVHIDINMDGKLDFIPANLPQETDGYINLTDASNGPANLLLTKGSYKDATEAQSVTYEYKKSNKFGNIISGPTQVTITNAPDQKEGLVNSCDGAATGAIGWIICPVTTWLAKGMDVIYRIIKNFLVVTTISNRTDLSVYRLWAMVRDIANICFVIVFLIIVYSQITNIGLSNYSLKKMLPRLIIAAILVNTSYIISAAAVDISNLLGGSIHNMFVGVMDKLNTGGQYDQTTGSSGITWSTMSTVILSGGAGAAALGLAILEAGGAIYFFLPFLVGTLLAALVALIVLAARQALIVCLVIISPLAFVAYVLPNTEKYFDKWKDGFMTLLLLFPIFSVVFSGAQLAGLAIIQNAGGNAITVILGMAVQVAPIVITPLLVKFSGGIIGRIAGIVNNPNKGLIDRTRNWSRAAGQEHKNKVYSGKTWAGKKFGANGTYNGPGKKLARDAYRANSKPTRAYENYRRAVDARRKVNEDTANNTFEATEAGQKLETLRRKNTNRKKEIENAYARTDYGNRYEIESRNLDAEKQEIENEMLRSRGHNLMSRQRLATIDKTNVENEFEGTTLGRQVDTAQRETERTKQRLQADHDQAWHFRNLHDEGSQERELRLRINTDKATATKSQVEAIYDDLKGRKPGDTRAIIGAVNQAHMDTLQDEVFDISQITSLNASRKAEAERALSNKLNDSLLRNGTTYQLDVNGNPVLDAAGNRIVVHQRTIDGVEIQKYATGVGEQKVMLAREVEKSRRGEDGEASAAAELMKHFNISASDYDSLAMQANATVTRTDSHGNDITFEFNDDAARAAAISWIAKYGSYGQKSNLGMSGGEGNVNSAISGFIQRELAANGFGSAAPWFNDITNDEMGQGRIRSKTDIWFQGFREIHEGRQKAETMAGANNTGLNDMYRVFNDRTANNAEWQQYLSLNEDMIRRQQAGKPQSQIDAAVNEFHGIIHERFDAKYYDVIKETERILSDQILRGKTTPQSRAVMEQAIIDYRQSGAYSRQESYRQSVDAARARILNGSGSAADNALISHYNKLYEK